MSKINYIKIGKIGRAFSLNGAFFVRGRDEKLPQDYKSVYIFLNKKYIQHTVKDIFTQNKASCLLLEGITRKEELSRIIGAELFIIKDNISLKNNEFLWRDLLGIEVIDSNGKKFGKITKTYNVGASDIIEIHNEKNNKFQDVPFVSSFWNLKHFKSISLNSNSILQLSVTSDVLADLWHD